MAGNGVNYWNRSVDEYPNVAIGRSDLFTENQYESENVNFYTTQTELIEIHNAVVRSRVVRSMIDRVMVEPHEETRWRC